MWLIRKIEESDFGCEERMPGEPLLVLVTIESDDGRIMRMEIADNWLSAQELEEGDEWPDDPDVPQRDELGDKCDKQAQWMENYLDALSEIDE